jgi:high-affinity K+ transport system ATPase subunit B
MTRVLLIYGLGGLFVGFKLIDRLVHNVLGA